jgi:hypothetical protein
MKGIVLLLAMLFGALALLGGWLYLIQDRLLYFPLTALDGNPRQVGLEYQDVWLTTRDGERLHAWYLPHPRQRGALLFLHGNAGNISHRLDSLAIFHRLGLAVLILDYRGYGASSGVPGERGTYLDAAAGWQHLVAERGFTPRQIVLFGRSLGGAVAAHTAAAEQPAGLILESTMSSVADLAADLYPWLPARWLTRHRYPAAEYVAAYRGPVLVAHSSNDEIVPYRHAARLLAAAGDRGRRLELRGGHNDGFLVSGTAYVEGLDAFLRAVLPAGE